MSSSADTESLPDIPPQRYDVQELDLEQLVISGDSFQSMDQIALLLEDILKGANKDIKNYFQNYLKVVEFKPTSLRDAPLRRGASRTRTRKFSRTVNLYFSDRPPIPRSMPDQSHEAFSIPELVVHWGNMVKLYENIRIMAYEPGWNREQFALRYPIFANGGTIIEPETHFEDITVTPPNTPSTE